MIRQSKLIVKMGSFAVDGLVYKVTTKHLMNSPCEKHGLKTNQKSNYLY